MAQNTAQADETSAAVAVGKPPGPGPALKAEPKPESEPEIERFFVHCISGRQVLIDDVPLSAPVSQLKLRLLELPRLGGKVSPSDVPVALEQMRLMFVRKEVQDEQPLSAYKLSWGSTVHMRRCRAAGGAMPHRGPDRDRTWPVQYSSSGSLR